MTADQPESASPPPERPRAAWKRWCVLAVIAIVAFAGYRMLAGRLSLEQLAAREAEFRLYQSQHPVLIYVAAFATYVAVSGLSLPGATAMTLLVGWLFGLWEGVLLVSFASTLGATIAFLLSRYLLRDAIQQRFGERLGGFNRALEREGAFYLFTLRMIPAVPFFVINVVMGLTPLPVTTYWWVSQIGMLPATIVYVYAGSNVPDLQTLADQGVRGILRTELIVSFAILGLFPLVVKKLFGRFRGSLPADPGDVSTGDPAGPRGPEAADEEVPAAPLKSAASTQE
mgnify:CR=1 FL=1